MPFEDLGLLFFTVLMLSLLFIPVSIALARYLGAVDRPNVRSVHVQAVPRLGGLGMAVAMLVGLLFFSSYDPVMQGFFAGLVVMVITGLADDVWSVSPILKLVGQIVAAVLFIEISGLMILSIGNPFYVGEIVFSNAMAYVVTVFCFVGTMNAFNLADGLDGLAAGIVAIMCFFLGFLALTYHVVDGLVIAIALVAAVLGFLKFNSHPAKLFMGDTGSLMLGFSVSAMAVILVSYDALGAIKPVTIVLILGLPVVDTLWVMCRRVSQGKSPASADKIHLHHRLLDLGLSHSAVVSIFYVCIAAFGSLALLLRHMPEHWQLLSGLALSGLIYALLSICEQKNMCLSAAVYMGEKEASQGKKKVIRWLDHSMKVLPYVILAGLAVPLLLSGSTAPMMGQLVLGLAIFVAAAFPWRDHHERQSIVHGLLYVCGFTILYVWNISPYQTFNIDIYMLAFVCVLFVWAALKIKFKRRGEVFLTSSFELLLIFISWFIPYMVLPALEVSDVVMDAAKLSCLGAIPLLIAMKLTIAYQPSRNKKMAMGLIALLGIIAIRSFLGV